MSLIRSSNKGATLLELIIAVTMVTISVVVISLSVPRATRSLTNNRHRWLASNLAVSRMQELKEQPYAYIDPSPQPSFGAIANCDCGDPTLDMTNFPTASPAILTEGGITFTCHECVNLVENVAGTWRSFCPNPGNMVAVDKGLKKIRLRVEWSFGAKTYYTDMESMVAQ